MEKVKIRKCESIMDGDAYAIEFIDGSKATAWNDKVDCKTLKLAYDTMSEIEVEREPYTSKKGKSGFNIVAIKDLGATRDVRAITSEHSGLITLYDAKQGNASANGQYQKSVAEEAEIKELRKDIVQMPTQEDYGEADITSISVKSSVKIKKNSKGVGWEIKVVTGEIDLIQALGDAAISIHKNLCRVFPVETII